MDDIKKSKGTQGFIKGALVLGIANFIVKIIGALFKVPLINLIGDDGSGYFNVAYQIYTFMFIIATAGFPVAISKMVSESAARGAETETRKIFRVAFGFLSVIGLIGTLIMFVFADKLAVLVGIPDATLGITAIAPAVFFVAMTSAYRGYFQGRQNMYPTAFSEVVESSGKMLIGLLGAYFFMSMTVNGSLGSAFNFATREISSPHTQTIFASAGAILGVTLGTLFSCLLLTIIYIVHRRKRAKQVALDKSRNSKTILKELIKIAIPITIGASVSSLTTLIDMGTISRRLVVNPEVFDKYAFMFSEGTAFFEKVISEGWSGAELLAQKAATLYGMYTGKALTMFNLPLTLIVALATSVVPAIAAAVARNNRSDAKKITESTIRISVLFAAPCAIGMAVLSREILYFLFSDYNAHIVLTILSLAIIPVGLVQVTNSVLQAYGKVYKPVIHMIIGGTIKVLINFFCIPYLGIDGAPIGTGICYLVIAVLNILSIIKIAGIEFKWSSFIIKPTLAALIMGAVGFVLSTFLPIGKALCLVEICICAIVYGISIFAVRAVRRDDILMLPKGEKIAGLLERYKLIK
ncbi:MAG: polysaccharide biosynthesis protein [Clostridia bacterium]|nr:polysaccharide biosynthesis protein [Clostridia bacterium]